MKKNLFLFALVILACAYTRAQNYQWAKSVGGTASDVGHSIAVDASGNTYVVGTFSAVTDFDPGPNVSNLTPVGNFDIFVLKLDVAGNFLWVKPIGGLSTETGWYMKLSSTGDIFIAGSFQGTVDFDPGAAIANLTSAASTDIFIVKLDGAGNYVWAKNLPGTMSDVGFTIALDASGNEYITGYFNGTLDFDPGPGTATVTSQGLEDIYIVKLDGSGNFVWAKTMGGTGSDRGSAVVVDATGNIFLTGYFTNTVDFDPGSSSVFNITSAGLSDVFILKLDPLGNFSWAKTVGGNSTDQVFSLAIDASGNLHTTGAYSLTADFDPGVGIFNLTAVGLQDIFVLKLDPSGNFSWVKAMGGLNKEIGYSIMLDASGNIYTTGFFESVVDFDPGTATSNLTSAGLGDIFISKLDAAGNFVWAKSMGGPGNDLAWGIALDASANVYATGSFSLTGDFDPDIAISNLVSVGSDDVFILKLCNLTLGSITGNTIICSGTSATLSVTGANTYTWNPGSFTGSSINPSPAINTSYTVTGMNSVTGCTNSAVETISVNALPTVTTSATSTLICSGQTTTLTASGGSTYVWDNAATTISISVNPVSNTNYTVIGTDAVTSCTNSAVETISVNALPTVTASATSTLICSGQTTTLTASGGSTYVWDNAATTISISVNPVSNTTYTVIGTDAVTSCTNMAIESISVNVSPTVTLSTSATSLCAGLVATLTPGGANTYTLNPGNTSGTSFTVSPASATQYTLTGTNLVNCSGSTIQAITVNALTNISGAVTSTAGTVNGVVILYQYTSFLSKWDSVSFSPINGSSYSFLSVPGASYVVRAIPTQTNLLETYGTVSSSWQGATTIDHDCIANSTKNINVLALTNIGSGQGSLSGKITEGQGYGQKTSQVTTPGTPIGGVIVKGGTNPGGNIMGKTTTNSSGQYTLGNLPATGPGESYYLLVDIPGLDTNKTYHRIMFTGLENYTQLDFIVDSVQINPVDLTVGINKLKIENSDFSIYPNPSTDRITIICELNRSSDVSIELTDLNGRLVQSLLPMSNQATGELKIIAGLNNEIKAGVYFVRIKVGNEIKTSKLVITN